MTNSQRESLGIISIFLIFIPSNIMMIIGIFYYPMVWIGLMLFILGTSLIIYALIDANKH